MKITYLIFSILIYTVFLSCSSSQKLGSPSYEENESRQIMTLEEHLLKKPGVFIQSGEIRIRGGDQSFFSSSEPLFEINGQMLTGGYQEASRLVNSAEIRSVQVMKNPDELAMYGTRGLNGVIKIKLKNSKE